MSRLGDALRAEALSAPYPRGFEALTLLAEEADRLSQALAADRDAFRGVLRTHNRMSAGRPFWGSCTCGSWTGPNTKFSDHVADALIDTRS